MPGDVLQVSKKGSWGKKGFRFLDRWPVAERGPGLYGKRDLLQGGKRIRLPPLGGLKRNKGESRRNQPQKSGAWRPVAKGADQHAVGLGKEGEGPRAEGGIVSASHRSGKKKRIMCFLSHWGNCES